MGRSKIAGVDVRPVFPVELKRVVLDFDRVTRRPDPDAERNGFRIDRVSLRNGIGSGGANAILDVAMKAGMNFSVVFRIHFGGRWFHYGNTAIVVSFQSERDVQNSLIRDGR